MMDDSSEEEDDPNDPSYSERVSKVTIPRPPYKTDCYDRIAEMYNEHRQKTPPNWSYTKYNTQ